MKKLVLIFLLSSSLHAFNHEVYSLTEDLHTKLNAGDSSGFFNFFTKDALLHNLSETGLETITLEAFAGVLTKFRSGEYKEDFTQIEVRDLETGLVYADVSFSFFINEKLAFTGIDHVLWIKENNQWKITTLYTGALKPKFTTSGGNGILTQQLDSSMNQWHLDVAEFRLEQYFNFMADEFIFLGTDPSERWTKKEFYQFCEPYFEKKSTWNFKTNQRYWYLNSSEDVAWFEESLDTWMEECRGSGVLVKQNNEWKIAHYNLSVLIENEKVDKFIKLRKK
ncbi:MAG: nuclear transport factor 2 family protein [Crocinitomicaceae bacterium]|nr:nuclear transport factor 2 family protein [Crocinitomicaceae bacterium]